MVFCCVVKENLIIYNTTGSSHNFQTMLKQKRAKTIDCEFQKPPIVYIKIYQIEAIMSIKS